MILHEQSFNAGPVAINYVCSAESGPPLVLLHGITNRWEIFLSLMPYFTQRWRVFALDLRGHGKSGHVPGGYVGEQISADVIRFLEQKVGEPAVLYGHSLGGLITTYIASHRPELVRAIALGDSPFFFDSLTNSVYPEMFSKVHELMVRRLELMEFVRALQSMTVMHPAYGPVLFKDLPFNDEVFLTWWARSLMLMDPEALQMAIDGRLGASWDPEYFRKISCPTLIIQADPKLGGLVTERDVRECKAAVPQTVHIMLENVGHSLHIHQPGPVLRALGNFLGSLG
ncbi:MAG TPA: alpha/beta hydrolase [Terriglobales bacterium]